MEIKDQFFNH